MAYNVYSLPDCRTVLYHPDVGTANLHQCGHGKITASAAGDLTSHTLTADGYVVVNKLKNTSGTITLEIPQNSLGDWFLRRWARWQKNSQDPSRIALGTLTIQDSAGGFSIVCTGVTLQKVPDRGLRPDRDEPDLYAAGNDHYGAVRWRTGSCPSGFLPRAEIKLTVFTAYPILHRLKEALRDALIRF